MNRADAYALMTEHPERQPAPLYAERRGHARLRPQVGQDEEKWGIVGLLHDFDYERLADRPITPSRGPRSCGKRLSRRRDLRHLPHADYLTTTRGKLMTGNSTPATS